MSKQELLEKFPTERLDPENGMAITAKIWQEAHNYHRKLQQFHILLQHGYGIIEGLEVQATTPHPSRSIYIKPGAAVDRDGNLIVVKEQHTREIHDEQGLCFVFLKYDQGRYTEERVGQNNLSYIEDQYQIYFRKQGNEPDEPYIELARINLKNRNSIVRNPRDKDNPSSNEINMNSRVACPNNSTEKINSQNTTVSLQTGVGDNIKYLKEEIKKLEEEINNLKAIQNDKKSSIKQSTDIVTEKIDEQSKINFKIGVSYLGYIEDKNEHFDALKRLEQALSNLMPYYNIKFEEMQNIERLCVYDIVYIVSKENFNFTNNEKLALYQYLANDKTLLLENYLYYMKGQIPPSHDSFNDLISWLGKDETGSTELSPSHLLLSKPFLFAAPPVGFEVERSGAVFVADGIIWSRCDYGSLWRGSRRENASKEIRVATREELRSATEWACNIIQYAVMRKGSS